MDAMDHQEIEVKFYISDLKTLEQRLVGLGAQLARDRAHESNIRFDTPTGELIRKGQVLRLREDGKSLLTFKGPASIFHGVSSRPEFEFEVSDAGMAREFIEALGYQVALVYEKYRAIYQINEHKFMLDEMPFGSFLEIEGLTPESIHEQAKLLGLNWDRRLIESYNEIFQRIKRVGMFGFRDMTFENFGKIDFDFSSLDILPADTN